MKVLGIYISPEARKPMVEVSEVEAIAGAGLKGDRYAAGEGSYNKGKIGKRQVTLINGLFFEGSGFDHAECRRNIITEGVELNHLAGKEFKIGGAIFLGEKYCVPCDVPSNLVTKGKSFKKAFSDRGGLIAQVIQGGIIRKGDIIVPPSEKY